MKKALIFISLFIGITITLIILQKLHANGQTGILLVHNHNPQKAILVQLSAIPKSPCFVALPKAQDFAGAQIPTETTLSFDSRNHSNNLIGKVRLFDITDFDPTYIFPNDPTTAKIECSKMDATQGTPFYEENISLTSSNPNVLIEYMEDGTVRMRT